MNETITIDGQDYEVLTLDRVGEITHAKLAGGKVVVASVDTRDIALVSPTLTNMAATVFDEGELEAFGIQPLKLIERVPVEFVGEVVPRGPKVMYGNKRIISVAVDPILDVPYSMFKLTQITEEEA